jgi:hypothetical protein
MEKENLDDFLTMDLIEELETRYLDEYELHELVRLLKNQMVGQYTRTPIRDIIIEILNISPLSSLEDIQLAIKENFNK